MSSFLKSPGAWEVEEKHHFQYLNKCKHTIQVCPGSLWCQVPASATEHSRCSQRWELCLKEEPELEALELQFVVKTQIQSIIIILWLISGGGKKLFVYIRIYIFIYTNICFCGKENAGILLRPRFKYCWREDRQYPREKSFCWQNTERQTLWMPILSSLNCFGGTQVTVSWRVRAVVFREIFSCLSLLFAQEDLKGCTTSLTST